jgi:two-component system, cell cycle sensor histidine kinase and response regulator CckA
MAGYMPTTNFTTPVGIAPTGRRLRHALTIAWTVLLLANVGPSRAETDGAEPPAPPVRAPGAPLKIGTTTDNYPYSYQPKSDEPPIGFAVDLADAVARVMNLPMQRVVAPGGELNQRFVAGEFDFLQLYNDSPTRAAHADFSVPFLTVQSALFVSRAERSVQRLEDLKGREIVIVGVGNIGEKMLRERYPGLRIVYARSAEEGLRWVDAGTHPAMILSRLTALSLIDRLKLRNVERRDAPVSDYDVRQCFAVHKGDAQLLARLNEGLAILHRTGEFDAIYRRWFGRYNARMFTRVQVVSYVAIALALALAVTLWGFVRQRRLRRRIAQQAAELAEQRALLQALYDNIPMAMSVVEAAPGGHRLISMNREAARLYAVESAPSLGRPLAELAMAPECLSLFVEVLQRWPQAGQIVHREITLAATRRVFEVIVVPLASGDSGHLRACVLAEDVTTRRQMDAEVAQSRKLRAVGELVGGIAHEFNNLLTPVMLQVGEIQLDWAHDARLQQALGVIAQAAQRAAELTRRLLTFGHKPDLRAESVRFETVVADCFALLRQAVDRRIGWESSLPLDLPPLYFNDNDLNQILLNLLLNARDTLVEKLTRGHHDAGWVPRIRVEAKALPAGTAQLGPRFARRPLVGWQRITVRDNGLGMPPEVIERIFEPFYTTKEVGKGTGLGLATVWHLVTEMGGRVDVESTPGEGTAMHLLLPVWPAGADTEVPPPPAPGAAVSPAARVLLVEDEELVARTVMIVLRREGHTIDHLADGEVAWRHLAANLAQYDLLVVDVNLPGLNGLDLVARARTARFGGRVLVMSGRLEAEERHALDRLQVTHVLPKPFTAEALEQAVRTCLAGPALS